MLSQVIIDNDNHREGEGRRGTPRLPSYSIEPGQKPTAQKAAWI